MLAKKQPTLDLHDDEDGTAAHLLVLLDHWTHFGNLQLKHIVAVVIRISMFLTNGEIVLQHERISSIASSSRIFPTPALTIFGPQTNTIDAEREPLLQVLLYASPPSYVRSIQLSTDEMNVRTFRRARTSTHRRRRCLPKLICRARCHCCLPSGRSRCYSWSSTARYRCRANTSIHRSTPLG